MIPRFFSNCPNFNYYLPFLGIFTSQKIIDLLNDRNIELFINQHSFNEENECTTIQQLVKLQKSIYKLDKYGETNWYLSSTKISNLWNNIVVIVRKIGFSEDEAKNLLYNLNQYMNVEINMRSNVLPNRISISDYYELKICDVQLQRAIIKSKSNQNKIHNLSFYRIWQLIDIVSEIIDDLTDLKEDSKDFNCNRLIISNHFRGTEIIKADYLNYCNSLISEFNELIETQNNEISKSLKEIFNFKTDDINTRLRKLNLSKFRSKVIERVSLTKMEFQSEGIVEARH